jgi:hypothetical protein
LVFRYSNLQEQLLARQEDQITELRSVWQIDHDEIVSNFIILSRFTYSCPFQVYRKRIDGETPGAFGEVSAATWQGRNVAVKRLRAIALDMNENSVAEFQREIEVNMSLRHKNIVYFFGLCSFEYLGWLMIVWKIRRRGRQWRTVSCDRVDGSWVTKTSPA